MLFYMIIVFPRIRCHFIDMSIKRHSKTANSTSSAHAAYAAHAAHAAHTESQRLFRALIQLQLHQKAGVAAGAKVLSGAVWILLRLA